MKNQILKALLLVLPALVISEKLFSQAPGYIFILSKTKGELVVLDYNSLDTFKVIPVGKDPHEIVITPDAKHAYISNPELNSGGHQIDVINLQNLSYEQKIDTHPFGIPHGLAFRNNMLWFTAQASKAVVLYDPMTKKIAEVLGTGQDFTHLLYVNTKGNEFYTTNVESGTLSIYQHKMIPPYMPPTGVLPPNAKERLEWRQKLITVGIGSEGFDVSPDGKELWTARPDGEVVIVDLEKQKITSSFNSSVKGLHRLKITPDGKTVCIVSVKTGELLYYQRTGHKLEQKVKIGQGAGIFMDQYSQRMFISCTPNDEVIVIDLKTRKTIKKLKIGRPDGITAVITKGN